MAYSDGGEYESCGWGKRQFATSIVSCAAGPRFPRVGAPFVRNFRMTGVSLRLPQSGNEGAESLNSQPRETRTVIAASAFFFALLQSVCTFFAALSGLRLLIGVSSLAAIIRAGQTWDKLHADFLRIPMMVFAVGGSLLNLAALRRLHRLRARPAAQWRLKPLTKRTLRMERAQLILSIATLILFAIEEAAHWRTFHRF